MGDDVRSAIVHSPKSEFAEVPIIHASTPDYCGSSRKACGCSEAIAATLPSRNKQEKQITILPGAFLTPADGKR
jgi:nitrogenase molybdenum-cofactor synthesis protein NifE